MELGIATNDPIFPILVMLQHYKYFLQQIPDEIAASSNEALTKALQTYGVIQTRIDRSISEIQGIQRQWKKETQALLPDFRNAFDEALKKASNKADLHLNKRVEDYQRDIDKLSFESLQKFTKVSTKTLESYQQNSLWQGMIASSGAVLLSVLAVGITAFWVGIQQGQSNAIKEFGGEGWYRISEQLINRADNRQRLSLCAKDQNPKCTLWIQDSPQGQP